MEVTETRSGDVTVLDLGGRITYMKGDDVLRRAVQQLVDRGDVKVVLNLGGVTYVDSAGLGELVSAHTTIAQAGGHLKLANLTSYQKELFTVTRLHSVFETFESADSAVESFAAGPRA